MNLLIWWGFASLALVLASMFAGMFTLGAQSERVRQVGGMVLIVWACAWASLACCGLVFIGVWVLPQVLK